MNRRKARLSEALDKSFSNVIISFQPKVEDNLYSIPSKKKST